MKQEPSASGRNDPQKPSSARRKPFAKRDPRDAGQLYQPGSDASDFVKRILNGRLDPASSPIIVINQQGAAPRKRRAPAKKKEPTLWDKAVALEKKVDTVFETAGKYAKRSLYLGLAMLGMSGLFNSARSGANGSARPPEGKNDRIGMAISAIADVTDVQSVTKAKDKIWDPLNRKAFDLGRYFFGRAEAAPLPVQAAPATAPAASAAKPVTSVQP